MSILNYFKIKTKANHPAELPDPNGPLSAAVPSSTIAAVNKRVSSTMEKSASTDKSRGPYLHLTDEQKYCVGKRASEFGVTNTMWYYLKSFPDLPPLKETSVRRFKNEYERAIKGPFVIAASMTKLAEADIIARRETSVETRGSARAYKLRN